MRYYVAGYVQGYTSKPGGKCWETIPNVEHYSIGIGTDKYMQIDGRLSIDNALFLAKQWAGKNKAIKDIYVGKCGSFREFLNIRPDTLPIGGKK